MDPLNAAVVILNTSRRQVRDDVVHQTDGKLEGAIWELQQQSEQECKQFKQELSAAYEDKVGAPFWPSTRHSISSTQIVIPRIFINMVVYIKK